MNELLVYILGIFGGLGLFGVGALAGWRAGYHKGLKDTDKLIEDAMERARATLLKEQRQDLIDARKRELGY